MLEQLPFLHGIPTRQISAENPTGGKGQACLWEPRLNDPSLPHAHVAMDMGKGWKVHPFITLEAGQTALLADIQGPGCINEFFITAATDRLSELVLRIYWDDEESPSVECPLGAFFAMGHDGHRHGVNSAPVIVAPRNACSCYWQMPFQKHARITLTHDGKEKIGCIAYRVLYKLYPLPEDTAYFHAQFRRARTSLELPLYTILDGVTGKGVYVGTYLAWNALSSDWWGEGEVKFYIDGDGEFPTMADNGTEDYFGGSFGFSPYTSNECWNHEQEFSTPYFGMPLACIDDHTSVRKYSLYRWHLYDSIGFSENLKVQVQTIGVRHDRYRPLDEDIASVAYFYQLEPHAQYPHLPSYPMRWER